MPMPMSELRVRGFIRAEHRSRADVASVFDIGRVRKPEHCMRASQLLASRIAVNASSRKREE
jgi:hypothetical protein